MGALNSLSYNMADIRYIDPRCIPSDRIGLCSQRAVFEGCTAYRALCVCPQNSRLLLCEEANSIAAPQFGS